MMLYIYILARDRYIDDVATDDRNMIIWKDRHRYIQRETEIGLYVCSYNTSQGVWVLRLMTYPLTDI